MWWKVFLAVLAVWLLFGVAVAVLKGALALVITALLGIGALTVWKWFTAAGSSSSHKTDTRA